MASSIDVTKPVQGSATTLSVRDNFSAAKSEIEALQAATSIAAATTTSSGVVELATGAEVNTGTDTERAITPDALDDWTGSAQITTVGTISSGTWGGTAIEGTAIASTGEAGGTKYLREDGDGTCSWQTVTGGSSTLDGLTDTTISGPTSADLLQWSGSAWVDRSLSEAGVAPTASPTFTGTVTAASITATGTLNFSAANISDLGTVTTADINGGSIDGTTIGGSTPAAATFAGLNVGTNVVASASGSTALDASNGNIQLFTCTGDVTFTDSLNNGEFILYGLVSDGTSRTIAWPANLYDTAVSSPAGAPTATSATSGQVNMGLLFKVNSIILSVNLGRSAA